MPETTHGPAHGLVCGNVIESLAAWSPRQSKGLLFSNQPAVVIRWLDAGHNVRFECRPDVAFIVRNRIPPGRLAGDHLPAPPDLAIEVFERGDRWEDVECMIRDCLEVGVREFWVLRLRERDLRVFRPSGGALTLSGDQHLATDVLPGFRCTVGEFFAGL
ncbi:MAG: Uma2 family endonuclease [Planctomycetaceae bacterium]